MIKHRSAIDFGVEFTSVPREKQKSGCGTCSKLGGYCEESEMLFLPKEELFESSEWSKSR